MAYVIASFLLPPYDNVTARTSEGDYNFFQSSACITVKCAFGEIVLYWDIFGKLTGCLDHSTLIIGGDMCLHNYLVEYRNVHTVEEESLDNMVKEANIERDVFKSDCSDRGTIHCYR